MRNSDEKKNIYEIELDPELLKIPDQYPDTEDIFDEILNSKEHLVQRTIDEFSNLISERIRIREKVLSDLEKEITRTRNISLEGSPTLQYQNNWDEPKRTSLEIEINKLEKARTDEHVKAWQDVKDLKKDIVELTNKLLETKVKKKMLKEK